jgi:hypothetical protein
MMMVIAWNPLGFHLLDALPKATHVMTSIAGLIFSQNFFRRTRRLMGGDSLFMLRTQNRIPPENAELFAKIIDSASPYTHRTHLILQHPTSFSSNISNVVFRESLFQ